jgi:hypothetical protein
MNSSKGDQFRRITEILGALVHARQLGNSDQSRVNPLADSWRDFLSVGALDARKNSI